MMRWLLLLAGLLSAPSWAQSAQTRFIPLDQEQTRLGFELSTHWGQQLDGLFPKFDGGIEVLPDGRQQVSLRMHARDVLIQGHAKYTKWARSEMFFDSERYPDVTFISRPYRPEALANGGELSGELTIRGISRAETLHVQPGDCERPGLDCEVVSTGAMRRSDYKMNGLRMAINDRVVLVLRARLQESQNP